MSARFAGSKSKFGLSKRVRRGFARVEIGTITAPGGKTFSNLGSVVDHGRGVVVGYPKGNELQSWDGKRIGTCRIVSSWKNSRGVFSPKMYSYRCTIDGVEYVGRGGGDGLLLRLRRAKSTR